MYFLSVIGLLLVFASANYIPLSANQNYASLNSPKLKSLYNLNKDAVVLIRIEVPSQSQKTTKTDWDQNVYLFPVHLYQELYNADHMQTIRLGSGFIITSSGEILTNNHVIGDSLTASVTLANGDFFTATVVGKDPDYDLALLKIQPKNNSILPNLRMGNSGVVAISDDVATIGHPFGYGWTLSDGIISGLNRLITILHPAPLIQIQSAINPGNSGGPLLNVSGEVIGIVQSVRLNSDGIGFAIPINTVKDRLPILRSPSPPPDASR